MSVWSLTYQQSVFKRYHSNKRFSEFYEMAAKTSWHRYRTKLRHCYPIYSTNLQLENWKLFFFCTEFYRCTTVRRYLPSRWRLGTMRWQPSRAGTTLNTITGCRSLETGRAGGSGMPRSRSPRSQSFRFRLTCSEFLKVTCTVLCDNINFSNLHREAEKKEPLFF